jgi:hypothetical protein
VCGGNLPKDTGPAICEALSVGGNLPKDTGPAICEALSMGGNLPKFQSIVAIFSSMVKQSKFRCDLTKLRNHLSNDTTSYPKRHELSRTLLSEPQISHPVLIRPTFGIRLQVAHSHRLSDFLVSSLRT